MSVKEHYDNHLASFYSWMLGDFETNKDQFKHFCVENSIKSSDDDGLAIDLGAGNGVQSMALAELGFRVIAVDFNRELLSELEERIGAKDIKIVEDCIVNYIWNNKELPELIVCCGDTIAHLESFNELDNFIKDCYKALNNDGKLILSFRDYSKELEGDTRFIPVKSDDNRILTCFLEYFDDNVRVTDLLYERENGKWIQKASSYIKLRINRDYIINIAKEAGFLITFDGEINRMKHLILEK